MGSAFRRLWHDESGQDLAEYAILLALIALVVIAALKYFAPSVSGVYNDVGDGLNNV